MADMTLIPVSITGHMVLNGSLLENLEKYPDI
jgi:undecaprenyl pyrophosphate phosphatase UppP